MGRNFARVMAIQECQIRRKALKKKISVTILAAFLAAVFSFLGTSQAQDSKITVLNPVGQPPAITRVPMAPRLDGLDGKTIYIVDINFINTHQLFTEMQKLLSERYPKTNWVVRTKSGTYFDDDQQLWAEIKSKGNGMIMGVGH
jgi:hypothetical protein